LTSSGGSSFAARMAVSSRASTVAGAGTPAAAPTSASRSLRRKRRTISGSSGSGLAASFSPGLFVAGDTDRVLELARSEPDRELKEEAIQKLGVMGMRTAPALLELYRTERDVDLRKDVIQAFFVQGNARALIDIAKTEKVRELKQEAIEKLSVMNNKEATEYLLQFLND